MWIDRNPEVVFVGRLLLALAYTHGPRVIRRVRFALRARLQRRSQRHR